MKLSEEHMDLFAVSDDYYLVHCISGDYALGAGIAKEFNERYQMREKLHEAYEIPSWMKFANVGKALKIDRVFNLVTRARYYDKPTYVTFVHALNDLRRQCDELNVRKIAMPKIYCDSDGLSWHRIKNIIADTFAGSDIDVLVCFL